MYPDCRQFGNDLQRVHDELVRMQLLDGPTGIQLNPCGGCTRTRRGGSCDQVCVEVYRDRPFRFVPDERFGLRPEIACKTIRAGRDLEELLEHTLLVRLWQRHPKTGIDAVVHRVHIDRANPGQSGPRHHLQLGGRTIGAEESWPLPAISNELRWPVPVFDAVLACELIVYTFYPDRWEEFRALPEVKSAVKRSEVASFSGLAADWDKYRDGGFPDKSMSFLDILCGSAG